MEKPMICSASAHQTDADTVTVAWETDMPGVEVTLFSGPTPRDVDMTHPRERSCNGKAQVQTRPNQPGRPCFALVPEGGRPFFVALRKVPMDGCFNFRDIGGYATADGRRVKWGQIFRSDALGRLTDQDHAVLKSMKIQTVCDFRAPAETKRSPDRLPPGIRHHHLPVIHGDLDAASAFERAAAGDLSWLTPDFMIRGYLNNIEAFPHIWQAVFRLLARGQNRPLVFHCSAGKDRAGTCAALVLSALGVGDDTVIADHGLSNTNIAAILPELHQRLRRRGIDPVPLAPYFQAPKEGIEALLAHLNNVYGSAREYLVKRCQVPEKALDQLKDEMLED